MDFAQYKSKVLLVVNHGVTFPLMDKMMARFEPTVTPEQMDEQIAALL